MKKIILSILCFCSLAAGAAIRTPEVAAQLAGEALEQNRTDVARRAARPAEMKLSYTAMKQNAEEPAYYAFNDAANGGWAVISADDRTMEVLCYSEQGRFDIETANPAFRFWMSRYEEEISNVTEENAYPAASRMASETEAISPLLGNIKWDQEAPYYNMCPKDGTRRSMTGCVATAMAQIMRYWRWPLHGRGEYTHRVFNKNYTVNFAEATYDWDNMLEQYQGVSYTQEEADAVALLMYHCGIATHMDYGANGSGSWTDNMGKGAEDYLLYDYDKFITQYTKSGYMSAKGEACFIEDSRCHYGVTYAQITEYFNADLEAGRPIIMGGESGWSGHEFVCDGRDSNGKFHINWGWSGDSNCYCSITSLKPSYTSYNFSTHIDAMIGTRPMNMDTIHAESLEVVPAAITLDMLQRAQLEAIVLPDSATFKAPIWTSSDDSIATVDCNGRVIAKKTGVCVITATLPVDSLEAECLVTVTENILPLVLVSDTLRKEDFTATNTTYMPFDGVEKNSYAQYAGVTASSYNTIQMRAYSSTKTTSAIYTPVSGGRLVSVEVNWNEHTTTTGSRYIDVYAAMSPYESPDDVYAHKDDIAGTMTYPKEAASTIYELTEEQQAEFLGLMTSGGAAYFNYIVVTWEQPGTPVSVSQNTVRHTAHKQLRGGQLYIRREGRTYDVTGRIVQ